MKHVEISEAKGDKKQILKVGDFVIGSKGIALEAGLVGEIKKMYVNSRRRQKINIFDTKRQTLLTGHMANCFILDESKTNNKNQNTKID